MADITAIRAALAANADNAYQGATQVSPYMLAQPTPPAAYVFPSEIEYDRAFGRGQDRLMFTVQVLAGSTLDVGAQLELDQFLAGSGSRSMKAAIESNRTLGGACQDLRVVDTTGYRVYRTEGRPEVLGAEWHVEVLAHG